MEEDPRDPFPPYALALEYMKLMQMQRAKELFEKLYYHHPEYLPAYYHYGKLLIDSSDPALASEVLEKGATLAVKTHDTHTLNEIRSLLDEMA